MEIDAGGKFGIGFFCGKIIGSGGFVGIGTCPLTGRCIGFGGC